MISQVFAVYDSKAATYGQPFFAPSIGAAIRAFMSAASDANTLLCQHPADFSLMQLATFDDDSGAFVSQNVPTNLGLASSFKEKAHA